MPKVVNHEARRLEYIMAASEIIVEQGLGNTSLRAVAKRAGSTTGALAHYFDNKHDLIDQALRYFDVQLEARIRDIRSRCRGRAALRDILLSV